MKCTLRELPKKWANRELEVLGRIERERKQLIERVAQQLGEGASASSAVQDKPERDV